MAAVNQNDKIKALMAKAEALKLEIARKDKILQAQSSKGSTVNAIETKPEPSNNTTTVQLEEPQQFENVSPQQEVLAQLREIAKMTKIESRPNKTASPGEATSSDFAALREVAVRTSSILEQEARKVVLGWKPSRNDPEAQLPLLRCLIQPLETVVASLMAAATLSRMTQVLSSACAGRATDACATCIALVEGVATEKAPPLCGMVESVCENIRKLPVSNAAAVKRQLLETARAVGDSAREFASLKESGKVDWGFEDDEDEEESDNEDEDEENAIDQKDLARLDAACKSLLASKAMLIHVGESLKDDVYVLDAISSKVKNVLDASTDFGVELYPPHDAPRVEQQAASFLAAVTQFHEAFLRGIGASAPQFQELKAALDSIIA